MSTRPTRPELLNQKSLQELATLLVKDADLHEGLFEVSLEIQIAIGAVGPTPTDLLPGALVGVKSVGLRPTSKANPFTVDAAVVNPPSVAPRKRVAARPKA